MMRFSLTELLRHGGVFPLAAGVSQLTAIPTQQELRAALDAELRRCRRYERPLTVLVIAPEPTTAPSLNGDNGSSARAESWFSAQLGFLFLGSLLRGTLRENDVLAYAADSGHFVAILPESDLAAAGFALDRIKKLFYERTSLQLRVAAAAYPRDGLIIEDLIDRARNAWQAQPLLPTPSDLKRNGDSHE